MLRKIILWIIAFTIITLIVMIAVYCGYCYMNPLTQLMEGAVEELDEEQHTYGAIMFFDIEIDSLMLGKWQHITKTDWYRVYTTEPAGDDFCWGREWNEAEDIFEEDLIPYGNGWFKWKKTDKNMIEWHMTDNNGADIPFEYYMLNLDNQEMCFKEVRDTPKYRFRKCE